MSGMPCGPVPDDHPLMKAWKAHQEGDDFKNTVSWAGKGNLGSLWACFSAGWLASRGQTAIDFDER